MPHPVSLTSERFCEPFKLLRRPESKPMLDLPGQGEAGPVQSDRKAAPNTSKPVIFMQRLERSWRP
ncbi:MAG TPA: hypothetical protein VGB17_12155 [Pyrinomonadaceae bacterium]